MTMLRGSSTWGRRPQTPGICRLPARMSHGGGWRRPRPFRLLSRRSGCVPAVPCPPLRYSQSGLWQPRRAIIFQRTAITPLTCCLTPGVQFIDPFRLGTQKCCSLLKTRGLLDAIRQGGFDAAIGGARREEEKSRAKERVFSFRDANGQWDPRNQRPEVWNLYNARIDKGQSMRVFPLSNWTEIDVWEYIRLESIPVVPLYFSKERRVVVRDNSVILMEHDFPLVPGDRVERVLCRMRSLGCTYCTGAIRSSAATLDEIIAELKQITNSERQNRVIDHDQEGSMELKKREGYF